MEVDFNRTSNCSIFKHFGCFTTTAGFQTCFVHHPKSSLKRQRAIGIVFASLKMSEANTSSLAISHPQSLRMIVVSSTRTMPLVDWHSIEKPWSFFSIHRKPVKDIWGECEFGTIQDVQCTQTITHIVVWGDILWVENIVFLKEEVGCGPRPTGIFLSHVQDSIIKGFLKWRQVIYIWANYGDFSRVRWAGDFIKVQTKKKKVFDRAEILRRFVLKHLW